MTEEDKASWSNSCKKNYEFFQIPKSDIFLPRVLIILNDIHFPYLFKL